MSTAAELAAESQRARDALEHIGQTLALAHRRVAEQAPAVLELVDLVDQQSQFVLAWHAFLQRSHALLPAERLAPPP